MCTLEGRLQLLSFISPAHLQVHNSHSTIQYQLALSPWTSQAALLFYHKHSCVSHSISPATSSWWHTLVMPPLSQLMMAESRQTEERTLFLLVFLDWVVASFLCSTGLNLNNGIKHGIKQRETNGNPKKSKIGHHNFLISPGAQTSSPRRPSPLTVFLFLPLSHTHTHPTIKIGSSVQSV